MSETMTHWLTKQTELSPQKIAIETKENETLTYYQLKELSETYAQKLASLGITKGSHIGLLSGNSMDMVVAIHALSYLGAIVVLLNTRLTCTELSYQLRDAEVMVLLASDQFEKKAKETGFNGYMRTLSEVKKLKEQSILLCEEIDLADDFTIIYTSGTTGFPKGVVHTYGNHWWSAIGSALNLGIQSDDKWLVVLPLFHVGGLSTLFKSVIYGMPILLLDGFNEEDVNHMIMDKAVTIASVVTVMLDRLIKTLGKEHYPDSFRTMLLGGGPAPQHLLQNATLKNIPVFLSYGMTETCSQIATLSPFDTLRKLGSAGKPLFPGQLKVVNQDKNAIGEILVKGPMVTKKYYKNEQATKHLFDNEWLVTGDMGYLDKDGFLYLIDRRTDLIISGGENIYPSEIEAVLSEMELIEEVGVTKQKSLQWGEVPVAFIIADQTKLTKQEIMTFAKKRLAKYKVPNEIYFIDTLPRNATNKLVRKDLFNMLANKHNDLEL